MYSLFGDTVISSEMIHCLFPEFLLARHSVNSILLITIKKVETL